MIFVDTSKSSASHHLHCCVIREIHFQSLSDAARRSHGNNSAESSSSCLNIHLSRYPSVRFRPNRPSFRGNTPSSTIILSFHGKVFAHELLVRTKPPLSLVSTFVRRQLKITRAAAVKQTNRILTVL